MKSILSQLQNTRNRQVSEPSPNNKVSASPLNNYKRNAAVREVRDINKHNQKKGQNSAGSGPLVEKTSPPKAENSRILSSILNYQKNQCLSSLNPQKQVVIHLQLDKENQHPKSQNTSLGSKQQQQQQQNVPLKQPPTRHCHQHSEKKAKYRIVGQLMCSTCAINYAIQKGLPIQHIDNTLLTFGQDDDDFERDDLIKLRQVHLQSDDNQQKLNGIETFIKKLNSLLRDSKNHQSYMQLQLTDQCSFIVNQLEQIVQNVYDKHFNDADISAVAECVDKYTKDAECIKKDILDNIQNIVQYMELGPFNLIIGKYREKLKQFESYLEQYAKKIHQASSTMNHIYIKLTHQEFLAQIEQLFRSQILSKSSSKTDPNLAFSPPPVKYVELLKRVNQTQASTSMFYNSILTKKENSRYKTEVK